MRFEIVPPTNSHLSAFRRGEWKECRKLRVVHGPDGDRLLRKYFPSRDAVDSELHHLSVIHRVDPQLVPQVYRSEDTFIDLEYIQGMRVFNIFQHLNEISQQDRNARSAKLRFLDRCVEESCQLQQALNDDVHLFDRVYYPVKRKIFGTLQLFDHCLRLDLPLDTIRSELAAVETYLRSVSCPVPFRDASPKNLILAWPDLWMESAKSHATQRAMIREAIGEQCKGAGSPLDRQRIVHIDFSSCGELTVPEDDPISLLVHESSWEADLPERHLLWLDVDLDPMRLAVGMIIRMYRYGGRRLAYRLVHANGHRARYGSESSGFYFSRLVDDESPFHAKLKTYFPAILHATKSILAKSKEGTLSTTDWFESKYGSEKDRYYRDVYPY